MTSTDYHEAHRHSPGDELLAARRGGPALKQISSDRLITSLKEAAGWPGADRNTVVTLALSLVAARAAADGGRYFQELSERNPRTPRHRFSPASSRSAPVMMWRRRKLSWTRPRPWSPASLSGGIRGCPPWQGICNRS